MKVAMTHLWSLPMWIMSLASASLLYLKYLLMVDKKVDLFLVTFWRSVSRWFPKSLSVHRVQCCVVL